MDCLFCQIIDKKIPAEIVKESENLLAFPDINPETQVHILIVPKRHIGAIGDLKAEHGPLLVEIYQMANDLVREYNLTNSKYRVRVNGGKAQHVPHIHFHLLGGEYKS